MIIAEDRGQGSEGRRQMTEMFEVGIRNLEFGIWPPGHRGIRLRPCGKAELSDCGLRNVEIFDLGFRILDLGLWNGQAKGRRQMTESKFKLTFCYVCVFLCESVAIIKVSL
jgi:hypothetical protein